MQEKNKSFVYKPGHFIMNKKLIIINLLSIICFSALCQDLTGKSLQQYFQNQEYDKAIQLLLAAPPTGFDKSYYLSLGYSYFMNDQMREALPVYLSVYDEDPQDVQANLYLGTIYQQIRKHENALQFYKNLTVLLPDHYKYWYYASSMFSALSERDSAFSYIQKAYNLNPKIPAVLLRYAAMLATNKEMTKATEVINTFLNTDSTNEDVIARKISYSFKESKYDEVIFWGERLLEDSAIQASAYINLAYAYLNKKQLDKCLALCDRMEMEGMKNESTTYCAALCYARKGDFAKSNLLLDECLKQNLMPEARSYFRDKADNFEKTKEYKKAIAQYDSSYYIFHDPVDLYYKARVYDAHLKNKVQASVFYKKYMAEKQKPGDRVEEQLFEYIKEYIKP